MSVLASAGRVAADGQPLRFRVDQHVTDKILISVAPGGFLQRIPGDTVASPTDAGKP